MKKITFHLICFLLLPLFALGQQSIPMEASHWEIDAKDFRFERYDGLQSMYLNGQAYLKGINLENGTIEVDIAPTVKRSFAGIIFRVASEGNYEEVYLRLHKSGMPDAIQYTPYYNNETSWQLYDKYQAQSEFYHTRWNHLKIVLNGSSAEVYLNYQEKPVLLVNDLKREGKQGGIGLSSLFGCHFANFSYTPVTIESPFWAQEDEAEEGVITNYLISQPMLYEAPAMTTYPAEKIRKQTEWTEAISEASGLLNINRFVKRGSSGNFERNHTEMVFVKTEFKADKAATKMLQFDYSDMAGVFLNGKPIYMGHNTFRFKNTQFIGHVKMDTHTLFLDLKKGENELLFVVAEKANGWGLMSQIRDTITPVVP